MGRTRRADRRYLDLAGFVLAVGGAVGVWTLASHNGELRAVLGAAESRAEEMAARDRLVGTSVPRWILAFDEPDSADAHLLWIVDPERCPACLAGAHPVWTALGKDTSLRRHLMVLEGQEVPAAVRRVLRGTRVTQAPRRDVYAALAPLLPSTKLLVNRSGIVLMADARTVPSECTWSFEAQVGALLGILASGLIRSQRQSP